MPTWDFSRRGFLTGALATAGLVSTRPADAADAPSAGAPAVGSTAIRVVVDGRTHEADVDPDLSALAWLRDGLGITSVKEACGHGACGACTAAVDGVPVCTCLLPATSLHRREVRTAAALGGEHPVQRAFLAHDALQCGFCTPGFVVEASAFHDRWRAEQGTRAPSRDEIAAALAGHLCRCAAYDGIYAAVAAACTGAFDAGPPEVVARRDGPEKVSGSARYTVDVQLPDQLEAAVLRAPRGHAVVRAVDITPALAMKGVHAAMVLTQPGSKVRYYGQEIAAVAAVDHATARAALASIRLDLDPKPVLLGLDAPRQAGAAPIYDDDRRDAPSAAEGASLPARWNGNVRGPYRSSILGAHPGRAERRLQALRDGTEPGTLIEQTYDTHVQCHTALEPHAAVADWTADHLTVHVSTQSCTWLRDDIAERWKLKPSQVTVLCPYVGGGFGAKATLQREVMIAVDLSRQAGRPVRVALRREEELVVGGLRPANHIEIALGCDEEGEPRGVSVRSLGMAGAATGSSIGHVFRLIYTKVPKILLDYDVLTHAPPGQAFRGPGGVQAFFAIESAMDTLAHTRGEDPITVRRRWDGSPTRNLLYDWAAALPEWRDRAPHGSETGRYRRGIGLASAAWFYFVQPTTEVEIELVDGHLVARCAVQDMGQGARSVLAHSVAEAFDLHPDQVEVEIGDSALPHGPMSGGSRTTASIGPAALDAIAQAWEALASWVLLSNDEAEPGPKGIQTAERLMPWSEILATAPPLKFVGRRRRDDKSYLLPIRISELAIGKAIPAAVQLVQVEVDTRLGKLRPLKGWSGLAVGRLYVPQLARSQALGGFYQGLSYALYEDRRLDPNTGAQLTLGLEDYRILGIGDAPPIELHFEPSGYEWVKGGGVGLGEVVNAGVPAALGNAVFHATGWRPRKLPLRPDVVLAGFSA